MNAKLLNRSKEHASSNLDAYDEFRRTFSWEMETREIAGTPDGKGLNIAYEAVDRHAVVEHANHLAIRFLRKNGDVRDLSYAELKSITDKFAYVLKVLGVDKGEMVIALLGRVPELYVTALGTFKNRSVFCPIFPGQTLLEKTEERVALKISRANLFDSLTIQHEHFYRPLHSRTGKDALIIQSKNKGTAPAILYSLLRLAKNDATATFAFFPSDHYFSDDAVFMDKVETAFRAVESNPDQLVLLGIQPDKAETSYGWIEPASNHSFSGAVSRVKRFWEKPSFDSAQYLFLKGCLRISFVMVGSVATYLELIKRQLPELYRMFVAASTVYGTAAGAKTMRSLYDWLEGVSFSSQVLERSPAEFVILRVGNVTWCDWGEPHRVLGTLSNLGLKPDWMTATV